MVYFLGRECVVAITTENANAGVEVTGTSSRSAIIKEFVGSDSGACGANSAYSADVHFAGARKDSHSTSVSPYGDYTVFGTYDQGSGTAQKSEVVNLTGVDLSLGAMDEDLSFIGQRATMRVEVKKENSITLTRKKVDDVWDVIYNDARFGVQETLTSSGSVGDADTDFETGLTAPDFAGYGYRVYLKFRDHTDANSVGTIMCIPNCCITEHAVTLGADATTEESMTFQSYLDPIIVQEAGTGDDDIDGDASGF